jgi:conjugal transfer mating pair stabilization protein TraN
MNFQLFEGFDQHCTKKPAGYMSCCKVKGWGSHLGASCNADEVKLQNLRERNLCVYVGKSTSGISPVHTNKHHFCCFGNMLNKVIQVEGRKQLAMDFGQGGFPNCRGLTLEEIMRLDFERIDFSEFILEVKKKMKVPNVGDVQMRAKSSVGAIPDKSERPTDENVHTVKRAGMSDKLQGELSDEGRYAK